MLRVTKASAWSVERALPPEAGALAEFAERSFRGAFGSLNDPADVAAYCELAFTPATQHREITDPSMTTFVARYQGELVGYAQLQDGMPPEGVDELPAVLLKRIYVAQLWIGTGVGRSLMRAVVAEGSARGARTLWLTVWERNPRAIRFYSRLGMRVIGEADFLLGSQLQRDLVMAGPVASLSSALSPDEERPLI